VKERDRLSRRELLGGAATALVLSGATRAARGRDERPNVLLLVSDDQSRRDLGAYGNPALETPHIDSLARDGRLFERMYTPVSICRPSRACLLTAL
jgi:arylsulfatase A-like enzyme